MAVPKLRFPEFTDDWEQRKLGDLGSLKNGMNFSKDAMGHGYAFVNLQNIFGNNVVEAKSLGLAEASEKQLLEYSLQKGDVLFVRSSVKLEGVGEVALVAENLENTTYSGFIIRFRDGYGLNNDFKKFVFATKKVRDQIMSQATNSANKNISQSVLENLTFEIPSKDEQKQIGEFFSNLDNLITLHQRKLEDLRILKKSMLQKMFPSEGNSVPEVRFPEFTAAWEQRKFGDVFEEYSEKNHEDLPPLTIVQGSGTIPREESGRDIKYDKSSLNNYKLVNPGDFILHLRSFEGGLEVANSQGIVSPAYHIFRGIRTDSRFYYPFFRSHDFINILLKPHVYGIRDGKSIDVEGMKSIKIPYPDFDEQKRIGDFFDHLDNAITLHQRKRDDLKDLKRVFLYRISLKSPSRRRIWQDELL